MGRSRPLVTLFGDEACGLLIGAIAMGKYPVRRSYVASREEARTVHSNFRDLACAWVGWPWFVNLRGDFVLAKTWGMTRSICTCAPRAFAVEVTCQEAIDSWDEHEALARSHGYQVLRVYVNTITFGLPLWRERAWLFYFTPKLVTTVVVPLEPTRAADLIPGDPRPWFTEADLAALDQLQLQQLVGVTDDLVVVGKTARERVCAATAWPVARWALMMLAMLAGEMLNESARKAVIRPHRGVVDLRPSRELWEKILEDDSQD